MKCHTYPYAVECSKCLTNHTRNSSTALKVFHGTTFVPTFRLIPSPSPPERIYPNTKKFVESHISWNKTNYLDIWRAWFKDCVLESKAFHSFTPHDFSTPACTVTTDILVKQYFAVYFPSSAILENSLTLLGIFEICVFIID